MKAQFFNNLIKQHLLPEFPGFVGPYKGAMFAVPMNHIWQGFGFESSSEPDWFYVYWNILPLYRPIEFYHLPMGNRLLCDDNDYTWEWDETKGEEIVTKLVRVLKAAKAENLDNYKTPLELGINGPRLFGTEGWGPLELFAFSLVYVSRFSEALPMLEELWIRFENNRGPTEEKCRKQLSVEKIRDLVRTDPEAARAQLLGWEQRSIKVLKLEKYPN